MKLIKRLIRRLFKYRLVSPNLPTASPERRPIDDRSTSDKCANCNATFGQHVYNEEQDEYICPYPHVEHGYGGFKGGDPRNFHPDAEACTPEQLKAHRDACERWHDAEYTGVELEDEPLQPCKKDGVSGAGWSFGIGVYTVEFEQTWKAKR